MSLTWYPAGQPVRFLDLLLKDGMIYADTETPKWPGEPSAIVTAATVAKHPDNPESDFGYYPSYERILPSQRRAYLEWLANGRRDLHPQLRSLGYLFLFFYGLERRICTSSDRDPALLEELIALLKHYGPYHKSRSLRGYFLSLAHYGGCLFGSVFYRSLWPRLFDLDEGKSGEEVMKLVLSNLLSMGEPLHWSIAYRLACADPNSRNSVVVTKAQGEFWGLFENRYENEFPGGIVMKEAKQSAVYRYQPANSALLTAASYGKGWPYEVKVANVLGLHSQFRRVSEIWNSCVDDLSGYTRAVSSKRQTDSAGLKAWMTLPAELKATKPNPMKPYWDWMTDNAPRDEDIHYVTAGSIAPWFGISERVKITKTQATEMAYGMAGMGWTVAPHPAHVDQPFGWNQEIAVYRRTSERPVEPQVPGLIRLLYLVMPIAAADGVVEDSEIGAFHQLISHEISHPEDWRYLRAVEAVLMRDTNVAVHALAAMTKHFNSRSRDAVFKLLVHIAAADGEVAPEEFKVLRKIARGLGLAPDTAETMLREDVAFQEVVVAKAETGKREGEPIPAKPVSASTGLQLDMDRIAALTRETHEVVSMLSQVMAEGESLGAEEERTQPESVTPADASQEWLSGLDTRYRVALLHLVECDDIDIASFDNLAAKFHLMPDDLFNSVNAWADETLGDFLLERADPIHVYRNLLDSTLPN